MQATNMLSQKSQSEILKIYRDVPKAINVLDAVRMNENAHTRFLKWILDLKLAHKSLFLKSFLELLNEEFSTLDPGKFSDAKVFDQLNYVDCRINIGSNTVLIENKIHYAVDGDNQIETYIKNALDDGFSIKNIYVVYLTKQGGIPPERSLSISRREQLQEKFKPLSYTDILHWLENDVLPNCPYREKSLIHSIELYIDHLKGLLGVRQDLSALTNKLVEAANVQFNASGYQQLKAFVDEKLEYHNNLSKDDNKEQSFNHEITNIIDLVAAIQIVMQAIEKNFPLENPYSTTSNLKSKINQNADLIGVTANIFGGYGLRYLGVKIDGLEGHEIHFPCAPKGLENGPYVLNGVALREKIQSALLNDSCVEKLRWNEKSFHLPFEAQDINLVTIEDIYENILSLIRILSHISPKRSAL